MIASDWVRKRPRIRLVTLMGAIALIAVGLALPVWYRTWYARRFQDAWKRPISMHIAQSDSLETILMRIKLETADFRLESGLPIYVDPIGLQEAEATMHSLAGRDHDATGVPAGVLLNRVLKPMGLACKLHPYGLVEVTSIESLDVPLEP
jgi:hypothetical protein